MKQLVESEETNVDGIDPARLINLRLGHPSTSLLATQAIRHAAEDILSPTSSFIKHYNDSYGEDHHPLHYGPDSGNKHIRDEIGQWVTEKYGIKEVIDGERINLASGASFALANVILQCTSPFTGYTKRIFIISPTYFLAPPIFQDAGFSDLLTSIPYPTSNNASLASIICNEIQKIESITPNVTLEEGLKPISRGPNVPIKRIYRYLLYCVPTFSNPTGTTWDLQTRLELLELARKRDILLISDDVYDFLGYENGEETTLLPRLVTLDRQLVLQRGAGKPGRDLDGYEDAGNTISNCSFSKLLGPGIRCGWVESATSRLARQLGQAGANRSGGCPSQFASTLVYSLLKKSRQSKDEEEGFNENSQRRIDRIIHVLSKTYTQRANRLKIAIKEYLPLGTEIMGGQGGYYLWVGIGKEGALNVREICDLASQGTKIVDKDDKEVYVDKVVVAHGDLFECPGFSYDGRDNKIGFGERWLRISVSFHTEAEAVEGIRRLGRAVERWLARSES